MKKGFHFILGFVALAMPSITFAETFQHSDFLYSINPDGNTVTLIKYVFPWDVHYPDPDLINLDKPAIHPQTGKEYIITEIGDGKNVIYDRDNISPIIIPDNIIRINDYAVAGGGGPFNGHVNKTKVSRTNNLQYIGESFNSSIDSLFINTECEIRDTESLIGYLHFGSKCPKINVKERAFWSIGIIHCTTSTPLDIKGNLLLEDGDSYKEAILIVPEGAKEAYKAHSEWGKFTNIRTEAEHKQIVDKYNARNFFTKTENGNDLAHYLVNEDDPSTATLVTYYRYDSASLDLSQPVINPKNGKSYTITYLGDGEHTVDCLSAPVITPNIIGIRDNAKLTNVTIASDNTSLRYIGSDAIRSVKNILNIPDGCTVKGALQCEPYYIRIGKNVKFDSSASDYITSIKSDGATVRIDDPVPPTVESDRFFQTEGLQLNSLLFVPQGSLQAYKNHSFWGKFNNIYEFDRPATVDIDFSRLDATEEKFDYSVGNTTINGAVNRDGTSVTVQKATSKTIQINIPAKISYNGTEYDVKAITLNDFFLGSISIPASVVRASGIGALSISIENPNSLMYLSPGSFSMVSNVARGIIKSPFTVNDGCVFNSQGVVFKDLTIGNIELLGSGEYVFRYTISNDETDFEEKTIRVTTATPPVVIGQMYPNYSFYQSTTVTVPRGSIEKYRKAREWKRFNLVEEPDAAIDTLTPDSGNNMTVISSTGELIINMTEAVDVTIYDISGRPVKQLDLHPGNNTIAIQSGIYIIAAQGLKPVKALVK